MKQRTSVEVLPSMRPLGLDHADAGEPRPPPSDEDQSVHVRVRSVDDRVRLRRTAPSAYEESRTYNAAATPGWTRVTR